MLKFEKFFKYHKTFNAIYETTQCMFCVKHDAQLFTAADRNKPSFTFCRFCQNAVRRGRWMDTCLKSHESFTRHKLVCLLEVMTGNSLSLWNTEGGVFTHVQTHSSCSRPGPVGFRLVCLSSLRRKIYTWNAPVCISTWTRTGKWHQRLEDDGRFRLTNIQWRYNKQFISYQNCWWFIFCPSSVHLSSQTFAERLAVKILNGRWNINAVKRQEHLQPFRVSLCLFIVCLFLYMWCLFAATFHQMFLFWTCVHVLGWSWSSDKMEVLSCDAALTSVFGMYGSEGGERNWYGEISQYFAWRYCVYT